MKESQFNYMVQQLVKQNGGYIIKTISTNKAGVADMLACINGRFCALEGKLDYNSMSDMQKAHHNEVIRAGGLSACIKSLTDVLSVIKQANSGYVQHCLQKDASLPKFDL